MVEYYDYQPNLNHVRDAYDNANVGIPDDTYDMEVVECGFFASKGDDCFQVVYEVISGDFEGARKNKQYRLSENMIWMWKRDTRVFWPENYDDLDWVLENYQCLIGQSFSVELRTEKAANSEKKYQNLYVNGRLAVAEAEAKNKNAAKEDDIPF